MVFELTNKVALVTGGVTGIGLAFVRQLLQHNVKGVVIADIDSENGDKLCKELENEFGVNRVVFVRTDISDSASFENAFKVTLQHFKNIDILINNAGVLLDNQWEKEIDINLKGTINGMLLGLENYLRNHKQGNDAVILNVSSMVIGMPTPMFPMYVSTKFAIAGLTKCFGDPCHFERTKVRVVGVCPGMTKTSLIQSIAQHSYSSDYANMWVPLESELSPSAQSPDDVARETMNVLEKAPNGTLWMVEESQPAYEYIFPDRTTCKHNVLI